jgi:hypothetical protein
MSKLRKTTTIGPMFTGHNLFSEELRKDYIEAIRI